jgi:hypothetical protein
MFTQNIALLSGVQIYTLAVAGLWHLSIERVGARLRWQSQPRCHGRVPGCVDVEQGKTKGRYRQAWNSISFVFRTDLSSHQLTGTTYSLLRTMFILARAADSIVRGSL